MEKQAFMPGIKKLWTEFKDPAALAATEYAILLALIVAGSVGVIGMIGQKFQVLYTMIADAVGNTI